MRRKLGKFELAEALSHEYSRFNVVGILFLSEGPSEDVLRIALDKLQQRHPLLQVKIEKRGRHYFFDSEGTPQIPLQILTRNHENSWKSLAEAELNQRLDTVSGPLVRCTYLVSQVSDPNSELILTCHHAMIDASSFTHLLQEILCLCADIESGETLEEFPSPPLLPPEEKFFPPAYKGISRRWHTLGFMVRQIADEFRYRKGIRGKRQAPLHLSGLCQILPMETSAQTTEKIIQISRSHRITINSILTAAMLLAVDEILYQGQDLPLRYFTFADLRPYLKPPVAKENLGTFHSTVRLTIRVKKGQEILDLAHRINIQIQKSFKRGDKFISALLTPQMMRMIIRMKKMRMGTAALSYPGVVKLESSYGKTQLSGIRGYISNFPLGPEYSAAIRMFRGNLYWDILYLDSDMDEPKAREIADKMMSLLDSLS